MHRASGALLCAGLCLALAGEVQAQSSRDREIFEFERRRSEERRRFDPPARGRDEVDDDDRERAGDRRATKLCSVVAGGNWRDTLPVPSTWTREDCEDFARLTLSADAQLGCLFAEGRPKVVWWTPESPPEQDCGWGDDEERRQRRRRE